MPKHQSEASRHKQSARKHGGSIVPPIAREPVRGWAYGHTKQDKKTHPNPQHPPVIAPNYDPNIHGEEDELC